MAVAPRMIFYRNGKGDPSALLKFGKNGQNIFALNGQKHDIIFQESSSKT